MKKIYFEQIDSTQTYAKKQAQKGIKNEIYIAKEQTSGIGRNGHSWFSNNGGLYFSYITDSYNSIYTLTVGVALYKALEELYGIKTKIKWPNDILLNDKKVAGIICEKVKDLIIVGIGVNTNFDEDKLGELIDISTTLKSACGVNIDNDNLLEKILQNINELICDSNILDIFRANIAFLNEERFISQIDKKAIIKGIDENGYLIVQDELGEYKISGGVI